ncbi:hypothetical protein BKA66DRAFT_441276 [Pyrenochaeta sp. MPI-SDFR-AT-0127]|nr:hypothetical protein BKA66DRAFT_441276 [Pyrenochaeta sp. MPI-SDFR-AT-0127]
MGMASSRETICFHRKGPTQHHWAKQTNCNPPPGRIRTFTSPDFSGMSGSQHSRARPFHRQSLILSSLFPQSRAVFFCGGPCAHRDGVPDRASGLFLPAAKLRSSHVPSAASSLPRWLLPPRLKLHEAEANTSTRTESRTQRVCLAKTVMASGFIGPVCSMTAFCSIAIYA